MTPSPTASSKPTSSPAFRNTGGRSAFGLAFFLTVIAMSLVSAVGAQTQRDPAVIFNEAQDAHERGDLETAVKRYREALEVFPDFPEARLQLGTALRQAGDLEGAEVELRKALELRENWALPMVSLASLLGAQEKWDAAEEFARAAVDAEPDSPAGLVALGDLQLRRGANQESLKETLARLKAAMSGRPLRAGPLVTIASLQRTTGDVTGARRIIEQVLAAAPTDRSALAEAVEISLASDDADAAVGYSERLTKTAPDSVESLLLRARSLASAGQNDAALSALDGIKSPNAAARSLRARIETVTSNDVAELEAKLKSDPSDLDAVARLCLLYRTKNPERALELCRLAAKSEPDNLLFVVRYSAALLQAGKLSEATVVLQQLKLRAPDNRTIRANLAAALFQQKRWQEAKVEYEWIAETQPEKVIAFYFLGIISDELREYVSALANYERFVSSADPSLNRLEIEKVGLRLPSLRRQIKEKKGK